MKHNESQFPTVHKGRKLHIYLNDSGEIFIKHLESGAEMRMDGNDGDINFTTFGGGEVKPTVIANSIGWRVTKK